jgi:GDP-mannose 6-dehydrogenase
MLKYINNAYHALKVAFANEVGRLCRALRIDSHAVMELFCKDTKQNISPAYLKPGFAFGGSCLPKDVRALLYRAKSLDVPLEIFPAVLQSNQTQLELGLQLVEQAGKKKVGLLGLSFKTGTDDLRESPLVTMAERLYGRGYELKIYDANVLLSRLVGSNKAYIQQELPHLSELLSTSIDDVVAHAQTLVVGNPDPEYQKVLRELPAGTTVIDLVRIVKDVRDVPDGYQGIGW